MKTENEKRLDRECRIVRELVEQLTDADIRPIYVHDGEEKVPARTTGQVLEAVRSVDESVIYFQDEIRKYAVFIVLGNDLDIITDHVDVPGSEFNRRMDAMYQWVDDNF